MLHSRKIIIIGDAGRGKSTLAYNLSKKLNISHHSTDDYFYEVKYIKPRNKQESIDSISHLFQQESWIVEGTTQHLLQPGLDLADVIIYLKYKNIFSQWFVLLKRHLSRKDESLKEVLSLMEHLFYKRYGLGYKKGKLTHEEVIWPYKDKVVVLDSFKKIRDFLNQC